MNGKWNKIWDYLKKPYGWRLVLIYVFTALSVAAALTLVIVSNGNPVLEIISYVSYGFAAISFGYTVFTIVIYAPTLKKKTIAQMRKSKFVSRLLDNWGYRTVVFAAFSLLLNVAYVVFNGVIAILSRSIWYGALATYYILLTVLRSGIVTYHRKKAKGKYILKQNQIDATFDENTQFKIEELKKYRFCGIILVILPISLSFAILQMVVANNAFIHYGWTVFAVAAYAFYKIIMAIYNVIKATKNDDMTIKALRCISLADALVSILALQTTLLYSFSEGNNGFVNALTGAAVCALTVALGIYMIVKANKVLKQTRNLKG